MYSHVRLQLANSFKAASEDLGKLAHLMQEDSFEFPNDYRIYEYLKVIVRDHLRASLDELGVSIERKAWHDITVYSIEIQAMMEEFQKLSKLVHQKK